MLNGQPDMHNRPLIDFVIIGAMRAGTTSFQHVLDSVEEISLPRMKETDFFIPLLSKDRSEDWYRGLVDQTAPLRGEISPNYSKRDVFPDVATRLHQASPRTKIIYVVRDPVKRAISQYCHAWLMGWDLQPPKTVLATKTGRHIINVSRYAWQLEPWIECFGRDQILVLDFEQFKTDLPAVLKTMFQFLELDITLPETIKAPSNSASELSKVPSWWLGMRDSRLGVALRSRVPNSMALRTKRILGWFEKPTELPVITPEFEAALADTLREDAQAFRALSGLPFTDWMV